MTNFKINLMTYLLQSKLMDFSLILLQTFGRQKQLLRFGGKGAPMVLLGNSPVKIFDWDISMSPRCQVGWFVQKFDIKNNSSGIKEALVFCKTDTLTQHLKLKKMF